MQIVALTFYRCFQCFLGRSVKSASLWPDGGVHSLLLSLCVAVHVVIWTLCVVLFCASCLCFCLLRSQSCSAEAGFGRSSHTLCSSSNHQRQLKYSWLFPLVASATSGDFLLFLLTPFVPFPEPVQLQTPAPQPPHPPSLLTAASSQDPSVDPPCLAHLSLHLSLSFPLPWAPATPPAEPILPEHKPSSSAHLPEELNNLRT